MNVSIVNLIKIKEIRSKILITLGLLLCYRVGFSIPMPIEGAEEPLEYGDGVVSVLMGSLAGKSVQISIHVQPGFGDDYWRD